MKKITKMMIMLFCLSAGLLFLGSVTAEAAETVSKGSYTYFAKDGTLYKMHNTKGTITKITSFKRSDTVDVFAVKGDWLYLTLDDYYSKHGSDKSWPYVCRIKTNGKSFKAMGQGVGSFVYGNYIYYIRWKFDKTKDEYPEYPGLYRMKLDGTEKKKLCSPGEYYYWAKLYNKRIYFCASTDNSTKCGIYSVNLSGKDLKKEATGYYTTMPYFYQNAIYMTVYNTKGDCIYKKDLKTGKVSYFMKGMLYTGYNGEIYYSVRKGENQELRRYNLKKKSWKKVCSRTSFSDVIGGKKWMIIEYFRPGIGNNIGVDRITLTGKSRKTIKTYFRS